jgi:O-antigen/teichoic acid export membrane protein
VTAVRSLSTNIAWNMGSLAFLAAAGLLLNFVIGRVYGAQALGLFNIVFALYILLSQLGVLGVHFSALRAVSEHYGRDALKVDGAVSGGLMLVAGLSGAVTLAAGLATPLVARVYPIEGIESAWLVLMPGLLCFALNKLLLNVINGAQHMRAFAVFQALRYGFILVALAVLVTAQARADQLPMVLSLAEVALLPLLLMYVLSRVAHWNFAAGKPWMREHLVFGTKVFASGTIGELNTRVDVLMLGAMLGGASAGVYSVALLLAEGMAQAVVVVRANINPLITRYLSDGRRDDLAAFGRGVSGPFAIVMALGGLVLATGFALLVGWLFPGKGFEDATVPLAILVAGLVIASPYMPFAMIFTQSGRPALQTGFSAAILAANVVFNLALIPTFGVNGAALGTALSYVVTAILLMVLMRRIYGIRLWV